MKKEEEKNESLSIMERFKKVSIPVYQAIFKDAVNNGDEIPESGFDLRSNKESRRVTMWAIPGGLLCEHKGKCFYVPDGNITQLRFK